MTSTSVVHLRPLPRRVLVTGGAGFIGSHLCRLLLRRGDRVTLVDDFSTGQRENVDQLRAEFTRRGALAVVEDDVREALPGLRGAAFHEIYHLAAAVGVQLILRDPIAAADTNYECTAAVLRYALESFRTDDRAPAVLLASSSEVYGRSCKLPFAEDDDVVYGATTSPRWSYAQAKALNEHLGLAYHREHGLPVVIARFFNTVGPGQTGA